MHSRYAVAPIGGALLGALTLGATFLGLWSVVNQHSSNQTRGRGKQKK